MSLALVQISPADFHTIYGHLTNHKPPYSNMHLREVRQQNKQRQLRYLHAMHAAPSRAEIEGMLSGPGVFFHYKMNLARGQTQLQVLQQQCAQKEATRIQQRFLPEILKRIAVERAGTKPFPRLITGQFYLRRRRPGMAASHANCQAAVAKKVLDPRFVAQLHDWDFELRHP